MKRAASDDSLSACNKKPASQLAVVRALVRAKQQERLAAKLKHIKENPRTINPAAGD
jgi:hypothetical protein